MLFGKHVNKYYKKYWYLFILGILALVAVDYFQLEIPEIYGEIINSLKNDHFIETKRLGILMLKMVGIAGAMFFGRFLWRNCVFGVGVRIEADMREEMFVHAEQLSQSYYKEHKTGAQMALFTNDLSQIRACFGQGLINLVDALFLGIFTYVKMLKLSVPLALIALVPMVAICIVSLYVGRIMEKKFMVKMEAYEKLSDFTQENFSGINVIKAFVKETNEIKHFAKINKDNKDINISFAKFQTILNVMLTFVVSFIVVLIYCGGSYVVLYKGNGFDVGELAEFVSYFGTITWPMLAISFLINMHAQGKASLKRCNELLDYPVDIRDEDTVDVDSIVGKIEFKNLNFKYPDGSYDALKNVSFNIPSGSMVGIVGRTGCGKTTVVDLLLRTYNVKRGEIFIDDKDIMTIPFRKVRDSIGYVPQDNFLFSDTIRNNIGFAYDEISEEEVTKAAQVADVAKNIDDFEHRYMTVLGERGVTLSGGQKQRVSIARALIKNPPILILDDSVSAVDTKTEESILSNLRSMRRGMTTILIAHRISTVKNLDLIILMDDGQVVDCGTHDELCARCPMYNEMVTLQSLEAEVNGGEYNE